jgi:hypothetical protein
LLDRVVTQDEHNHNGWLDLASFRLVLPWDSFNPLMGLIQQAAMGLIFFFLACPFFFFLGQPTMASHAAFHDTISPPS